jgi:UDP-N-acetylglucosamine--N-acetylmuramyl-(pentapeptide) pyrophosphoryl-undecaprenol N-acetylglucosamine transferase
MSNHNPPLRAVIAGGGTGGHLYPAIAIARAVLEQNPDIEIHFVGAAQGLETQIVPREGFPLHLLPVQGLSRMGRLHQLLVLLKIPIALWKSATLALKLRPRFVLGVGGYASGPFVLMASLLGFRTFIWEPNAHSGMTNRWLARFVDRVLVVFEDAAKSLTSVGRSKIEVVGLPVRKSMHPAAAGAREEMAQRLSANGKLRVLVFGGSQGARAINTCIINALEQNPRFFDDYEIRHQTGAVDFESIRNRSAQLPLSNYTVLPYIHEMAEAYQWADIVFCRSGASTIAELAACEKAAVLIPLPTAADDHQRKNAASLNQRGAARIVEQAEFIPEFWMKQLTEFRAHPNLITQMEDRIKEFHQRDPGQRISQLLLG